MANLSNFTTYLFLTVFCLTGLQQQNVAAVEWVHGGVKNLSIVKEITNLLDKLHVIPSSNSSNVFEIMDLMQQITVKIDSITFRRNKLILESVIDEKNSTQLESNIRKFHQNLKEVQKRYNRMKTMLGKSMRTRNISIENIANRRDFAESNVAPTAKSVTATLNNIFSSYLSLGDQKTYTNTSLADLITWELRNTRNVKYYSKYPAQQQFYWDYFQMTMLGIQGYLINKFSLISLGNFNDEILINEDKTFTRELEFRSNFMTKRFRELIAESPTEIKTSDPPHWIEKENYEQLTRLLQGYLINEVNLNEDNSCKKDCQYYKSTKVSCYKNDPYCKEYEGTGKVVRCESDSNNDEIHVCHSNDPIRRYEYVMNTLNYHTTKLFGQYRFCSAKQYRLISWITGFYRCSNCFCLIDEKGENSDRFFSLREVLSDVDNNKVVTGVRFVKKNRIIHLQIQEGNLAPFGLIEKNTVEWKDVEDYEMADENDGVDYVTFDDNRRSINLDDVQIEDSTKVLTGVKLEINGSHLYLKVRVTEYNFENGTLVQPQNTSEWFYNNWEHKNQVPLYLKDGPKVSTLATPGRNAPSPGSYDYVQFTPSSKNYDASQTTLPFIDTQSVVSNPSAPLSGVGLYHRGLKGYGGFIAPKIFTLNFLSLI